MCLTLILLPFNFSTLCSFYREISSSCVPLPFVELHTVQINVRLYIILPPAHDVVDAHTYSMEAFLKRCLLHAVSRGTPDTNP